MITHPRYSIEVWPHGWLLCSAPGHDGVPMSALNETARLFPKKAVMSAGVPKFYNARVREGVVVFAVCRDAATAAIWEKEITETLATSGLTLERQWMMGIDTGLSSMAIYDVLAYQCDRSPECKKTGDVPRDSADFGRCTRLLAAVPGWRERLPEVAAAYPATKWPALIARWDEIAASSREAQTEILRQIGSNE